MKLNLNHPFQAAAYVAVTKYALFLIVALCCHSAWAQLTVSATTTPQTCAGNGSITITASGQTAGTTINYIVHQGNDTTGPIVHNSNASFVGGQPSGNYYILANEMSGSTLVTSANTTVVIDNQTAPIAFALGKTPENCSNGTITVNVTAGNPSFYRLTPFPTGTPVQQNAPNNIFTDLTAGQYTIYVEDACGDGNSQVITILFELHELSISGAIFPDSELPACDKLTISNNISSTNGADIIVPLQAEFTLYPPGGGTPIVIAGGVALTSETSATAETIVDYHYNEPGYQYKLTVTDICGTVITTPLFPINPMPSVTIETKNGECLGKFIEVRPLKYVGPFTLQFTQSPPGFNASDYNSSYPGPYTTVDMPEGGVVFGEEENTLPIGEYQVQVFDACNRPIAVLSSVVEIPEPETEVTAMPVSATCAGNGSVTIDVMGLDLESAIITGYTGTETYPVPNDVSHHIVDGEPGIVIPDLPPGDYILLIVDKCGNTYDDPITEFTITLKNDTKTSISSRPDCQQGLGTLNISDSAFETIEMISAPSAFTQPLPYNLMPFYVPGLGITLDALPPGQYKFKGSNLCDDDIDFEPVQVTVLGLNYGNSTYNFIPYCGSFDVFFNHLSNGVAFVQFGLQQYNEATGNWLHPNTGYIYAEGDELIVDPDDPDANALKLTNNTTNSDLAYPSGKYRIMKQYQAFSSAGSQQRVKLCQEVIYEFEYFSDIQIEGAVSLDCMGNSGDVQILANGVPPLHYEIIAQNGTPYTVDNGENNIFSGLDSAIYTVRVSDQCSQRTINFNVADIPSLVSAADPADLQATEVCDQGSDNKEVFDITPYTPLILGTQDPDDVTITYHMSQADALSNSNPIGNESSLETGTVTIYARVQHKMNADCAAITYFDLIARQLPQFTMKDTWTGCEGEDVTIIADAGFVHYEWKKEGTSHTIIGPDNITVSDPGKYTLSVRDSFGCENSKTVEVVHSPLPTINKVVVDDWTDNSNIITVLMEPTTIPSSYEYSLDGKSYQDSPVFTGLVPGQYTVYVRDKYECGRDQRQTYILTYPKFFTPNGDNINDFWKIKFSMLEPDMLVYVYDRYGKLITGFGADSKGWDGTLNGTRLPATDYWFVVKRQNGEELRGHFSMIR